MNGEVMYKTQLRTSQLGATGLEIARVGFGAWALGGGGWEFGWGPQQDEESIAAIQRAVELGINWIDTAAGYGFGRSERVVGPITGVRRPGPGDPIPAPAGLELTAGAYNQYKPGGRR